jgi:hypothetical protein
MVYLSDVFQGVIQGVILGVILQRGGNNTQTFFWVEKKQDPLLILVALDHLEPPWKT